MKHKIILYTTILLIIIIHSCNYLKLGETIEVTIEIIADDSTPANEVEETINIISSRINSLDVGNVGIQKLTENNQYLITIRKVKEDEIQRIENLITANVNFGFWETYDFTEISSFFMEANKKVTEYYAGLEIDSTDTSLVSDIEKSNPLSLFAFLQPNIYQNESGQYYPRKGPVIGYSILKDTATINKLLKLEIVKNEFPRKLKLCWSITTFRDFTADTTFELIALKRNYNDEPALDGRFIIDAKQTFNQGGSSEIAIEMNNQGAKTWRRLTSDNINKSIAIVCDDQVFSYPTVQGEIPNGRSSITGNFTVEEAKDIASIMKFGRLPLNVKIINKKTLNSH